MVRKSKCIIFGLWISMFWTSSRVVSCPQPLPFFSQAGVCEFVFSVIVTIDLGLDENINGLGPTC
ncbi:hypothetical protein ACJW30_09G137700 [Castanea mollissima]